MALRRTAIALLLVAWALLVPAAMGQIERDEAVDTAFDQADRLLLGDGGAAPPKANRSPVPDFSLQPAAVLLTLMLSPFIVGGIRHINRHNVLDHPARQRIYEHLWETGGSNLRAIADGLSLSSTNATWHLDKLLKAELVNEVEVNGGRMYYPRGAGKVARDLCKAKAALANDNARAVLEAVRTGAGSHQREIARTLGVNHGTVRWHLQRLEEAGLIRPIGAAGRAQAFQATPLAEVATGSGSPGAGTPVSQVPQGNL